MPVAHPTLHRAARKLPASPSMRPPSPTIPLLIGLLASLATPSAPALATVPPYAEEWSTPAAPQDVEVDPFGRVWVSCSDDTIRVYAPTGGGLLFAFGGTGAGDGQFSTPYGIAFDPGGDAYICDYAGARVEKFTSEGVFLLAWSIPSDRADHVAVDSAGDVYVTGYTDLTVHKHASDGSPLLDWTTSGGTRPSGIVEAAGTIHVVQWDAPGVEQFGTDGTFLGSFDPSTIGGDDVEVDAGDQLWIADYGNHRVRVFTTSGDFVDDLGTFGSGPGEFSNAIAVAIASDGSVYVGDEGNSRVQRFGDPVTATLPDPSRGGMLAGAAAILSISPNPCRDEARLRYSLPHAGPVGLFVTDVQGRIVARLAATAASAGVQETWWAPRDAGGRRLPSGVYMVGVANGGGVGAVRLTVID